MGNLSHSAQGAKESRFQCCDCFLLNTPNPRPETWSTSSFYWSYLFVEPCMPIGFAISTNCFRRHFRRTGSRRPLKLCSMAASLDTMPRRPLGNTGMQISVMGFGASPLGGIFRVGRSDLNQQSHIIRSSSSLYMGTKNLLHGHWFADCQLRFLEMHQQYCRAL